MNEATAWEGEKHPVSAVRRWLAFLVCVGVVWMFMFVLAPMMQRIPPVGSLAASIEETGINASALYYTGVDETAEAGMYLHNARTYTPGRQ